METSNPVADFGVGDEFYRRRRGLRVFNLYMLISIAYESARQIELFESNEIEFDGCISWLDGC